MSNNLKTTLLDLDRLTDIIPLVKLLNPGSSEKELAAHIHQMKSDNYHCMGLFHQDKLIGICGMWILHKFYVGKHLEPDHVVILPDYRNRGGGQILMDAVYKYAQSMHCEACELNVYVDNTAGQEFWLEQGFQVLGLHMQKKFY